MSKEIFGITEKGFKKRSYANIKEKTEELLKQQPAFGEDIDFTEEGNLYQLTAPFIFLLSELWEVAEQCLYTQSPKYAEGNILASKGKIIGMPLKRGNKAVGTITITGDEGTEIEKGFKVGTKDGIVFYTIETKVIPEIGTTDIKIEAEEIGTLGNVEKGSITEIMEPILGIKSVTNTFKTENGENVETDVEFRERYDKSVSLRSTNTFDSIISKVTEVAGVRDVFVDVNDTINEKDGIPPKSFHVIVFGGDDKEVAKAIFEKYAGGIQPYGTTKVEIEDTKKQKHLIGFSRPIKKEIYVKLKITQNENFQSDNKKAIKEAVKKYFDTFRIGQNVVLYKIISSIDKANIEGIDDIEIEVSTDEKNFTNNNIDIKALEVATIKTDNIEVI